ncbi:type I secretion C-terminal target domain-containing protein [Enterovibrio makurazakiensis]|uniref:type I secretion C-terminal target domain-containing protein n=1 Tax=Enterovibrio makurazakiensis TaxID=2910232 RepID=UPI003D1CC576
MASKLIITQLNGEALIFASDGSVRVAEMYAELKPDEVLVTERGGAVLKENGEREINVGPNSGFLFEPPPNQDDDLLAARQGVEEGDVFAFLRGDADAPAVDIITDFNVTEGDNISLYDLLEGANDDNIGDYLVSLADESGKATLSVASDGETVDQKIVFEDKSLAELSDDVLGLASGSGAEILEKMLLDGMLVTQQ